MSKTLYTKTITHSYGVRVTFLVGERDKAISYLKRRMDIDIDPKNLAFCVANYEESAIYVFMPQSFDIQTVVHELYHATFFYMEIIGDEPRNSENEALFIEWATGEFMDFAIANKFVQGVDK